LRWHNDVNRARRLDLASVPNVRRITIGLLIDRSTSKRDGRRKGEIERYIYIEPEGRKEISFIVDQTTERLR
jgi:hypothetical protein